MPFLMLGSSCFNLKRKAKKCKVKFSCFLRGFLFDMPFMAFVFKYVAFKVCLNKM